jgi:hypothetical protein
MKASLFRTRVAVLWVAVAVAVSYSVVMALLVPGVLPDVLAGRMEDQPLDVGLGLQIGLLGVAPLLMAAVALLVGDRANPYVNLVGGLLVGLAGAYAGLSELAGSGFDAHVLLVGVSCLLALLVAGLSAAALRRPEADPAARAGEPARRRTDAPV